MLLMIKGTNKLILETFNLPIVHDIYSFADAIGLSHQLIYVLSQDTNYKYYKNHKIPKKNGDFRYIYEPSYSMKLVQRWILEEILYKIPVTEYTFGFRKGISAPLKRNAEVHKDNLFIFKMDLKNFFPSVNRDHIYYLFSQIGYNPTVANLLSNLCTLDGALPQGAVTSPCISNLVCRNLDKRISKYCNKREIKYTRYADDFTFSSNDKSSLKSIYPMIQKIVEDEGFTINTDKTRLLTPKGKKTVTGITVNGGLLKVPKQMKRNVRAMLHQAIVTGDYSDTAKIKGYIAYISSIEDDYLDKVKTYINRFSNHPICMFEETVTKFNANKFFKDLEDFTMQTSFDFILFEDADDFESTQYRKREAFIETHHGATCADC